MHGLWDDSTSKLLRKPWGWFSSIDEMETALSLPCTHRTDEHEPVQGGRRAAISAVYPYLLCRRFAKVLMKRLYQGDIVGESGRTSWKSSTKVLASGSEEAVGVEREADGEPPQPPHGADLPPEDKGSAEAQVPDDREGFRWDPEIRRKLARAHNNLGHPNKEAFLKPLRDAGAEPEVLRQAQHFDCPVCLQRGRRAPTRPATVPHYDHKWHCMRIDTFWWHTPKEALQGQRSDHLLCLSMLDEACDYHIVYVVKGGQNGPQTNLTGPEFRQAFTKGWLRFLPAPKVLRYDEEGFLKRLDVVEWLEGLGIRLEPVAGESPWQVGKHSRHIQTLKESMNLMCMEYQNQISVEELVGLSVSAKNNMHNVRGYSPNQWALGQNHQRISSFLSQEGHLPTGSAREDRTFEEILEKETAARKYFLEIDARRRVQRALRVRSRPLQEYKGGELVYYYRRGRKEGSRYGGHWYGPARVLCHEKTGDAHVGGAPGSIVWVSHAGRILRCSPEQLRRVTEDLRRLDQEVHGPRGFYDMLAQISNQQRYLDITIDCDLDMSEHAQPDENAPRFRVRGKQSSPQNQGLDPQDLLPPAVPPSEDGQFEGGPERSVRGASRRASEREVGDGTAASSNDARQRDLQVRHPHREVQGEEVRPDVGGRRLPSVVDQTRVGQDVLRRHEEDPRARREANGQSSANEPGSEGRQRQQKRVRNEREGELAQEDRRPPRPSAAGDGSMGRGHGPVEPCGGGGDRSSRTHDEDGASAGRHTQRGPEDATRPDNQSPVRSRSRSPKRTDQVEPGHALFATGQVSEDAVFQGYVGNLCVLEMEFPISPRDVHKSRGIWVVNQKARKNVEVSLRKLTSSEKAEFDSAMRLETTSFMSTEAVRICERAGIPRERIMNMRFVLTWKTVCDSEGSATGRKAKARLIVRGFEDPGLLEVERESPTLSNMGRNLLLAECSQRRYKVSVGDIKTAFLRGDDTELSRQVYADPPKEVKEVLGMTDTQIFRMVKAIYGLLHAPKKSYESLSRFLKENGWQQHALDQCLYKLVGPQGDVHGYIGIHVDDIVTGGQGSMYEAKIAELRARYPFGSWQSAQEEAVIYCGCELSQDKDFRIKIRQERFAQGINEIAIQKERQKQGEAEVTVSEKGELRRVLGALNWRATQSAPWLLATVSHLQGRVEVEDLLAANKLVRLQRGLRTGGFFLNLS